MTYSDWLPYVVLKVGQIGRDCKDGGVSGAVNDVLEHVIIIQDRPILYVEVDVELALNSPANFFTKRRVTFSIKAATVELPGSGMRS